jgi:hypothetical protein
METKFIEGTNEQYSIREDGVVIRHYKFLQNKKIVYEESFPKGIRDLRNTTVQFNICKKQYSRNKLLIEYFGKKPCANPKCCNAVTKLLYSYCEGCQLENDKRTRKKYRKSNSKKLIIKRKEQYVKDQALLPKHSIAGLLKIPVNELPDELYKDYRNLILFKRKVAKENNININSLK